MTSVRLRYVNLRRRADGSIRPRFEPGPRERALGFRARDLRHDDGSWFSVAQAADFAERQHGAILAARGVPEKIAPASAAGRKPSRQGYVYFLRTGDRMKIGFSKNPWSRVGSMRTGLADEIQLLLAVRATAYDEQRVHAALRRHRIKGEWYVAAADVLGLAREALDAGRAFPGASTGNQKRTASELATGFVVASKVAHAPKWWAITDSNRGPRD